MPDDTTLPSGMEVPMVAAIVGCLATVMIALLPLAVIDAEWASLSLYFEAGLGGLWVVIALSLILAVVLQAGRSERTDPALAIGIGLGAGIVLIIATVWWAISVDAQLVAELSPEPWFASHRVLLVLLTVSIPTSCLWAAMRVDLL